MTEQAVTDSEDTMLISGLLSGLSPSGLTERSAEWAAIVGEHSARVYRLAYRLTGNRQDAEDLTQDVFVRVFRSLDSFEPGNFAGWLHRITTNLFLDRARRAARIRMDGFAEGAEQKLLGSQVLPEDAVHDAGFDPQRDRKSVV